MSVSLLSTKLSGILYALLISTSFIIFLGYFFEIYWETNDDIAMSMIAHGYGLASTSSPNLFFSNVIWGHLVRIIPSINGNLGYSIATLVTLIAIGTTILYGLRRCGINYWVCLLVFSLLMVRPILFPQFTINSGLLLLSAIIYSHLYAKTKHTGYLIVACVFALFSYWVRSIEFFFVLMIALPLLPWKSLSNLTPIIAIASLFLLLLVSTFIDQQSYQKQEWQNFIKLNKVRAPITDFGANQHLLKRPDILEKHSYSNNDINLIRNWFFVDPAIANPTTLQVMINALEPLPINKKSLRNALVGLLKLARPVILALTLFAMLLFLMNPSWKLAISWGLFIAAVFMVGLSGRPGVSRIYIPVLCMLVLAPFLFSRDSVKYNKYFITFLIMATLFNISLTFYDSKKFQKDASNTRQALHSFPQTPVVIWGSSFPLEAVYPVLASPPSAMSYQFYALGVFTHAPFSISYQEQLKKQGFIDLFTKDKGITIIANKQQIQLLKTYCKEHHNGNLNILSSLQFAEIKLTKLQCRSTP